MNYPSSFTLIFIVILMAGLARSASTPIAPRAQRAMEAVYEREGRGEASGTQVFSAQAVIQPALAGIF